MFFLIAFSVLFRVGAAQAIPVPTIGAELATQIDQLTKHIDELKKVKDQINNGIEQAKAMGDKMSMDALKNFAKEKANGAMNSAMQSVKVPKAMKEIGLSEDSMKDPEKVADAVKNLKSASNTGNYEKDMEVRKKCWEARDNMRKELSMNNLANSFSLQQKLSSGEEMKNAQSATNASDDQMQLIGANTATLKLMYQQESASTMMAAGNLANEALDAMCE